MNAAKEWGYCLCVESHDSIRIHLVNVFINKIKAKAKAKILRLLVGIVSTPNCFSRFDPF